LPASSCAPTHPEATGSVGFEGSNQHLEYHRSFGGQTLGQFVRAAETTARPNASNRCTRCSHARAKASEPVRYEITRQHEGRSFATLGIVASQSSGVIGTASVSMHADEEGPGLQTVDAVPPVLGEGDRARVDPIPWEIRTTQDLN
jgi:acyl-CoA thioesterase-2